MKRRNAEIGKRRPVKRIKITEGMYGNSMLYLKLVMVWATVVLADYMLEFRFELLWPFWMMLRSLYDSFKYQGLAFSVFFICIALTSDMICFFFIPLQYIFFAASTYVWVQYVWYTFADKGICFPTVALCCVIVYVEGVLRGDRGGGTGGGLELYRPLAAHCVGYPVVTLGFGVKSYVGHRLRLRRQRQVRAENEFYFQLMKDALPESAVDQSQQSKEVSSPAASPSAEATPSTHMNGSVRRRQLTPTKLEKVDKKCHAQTNGTPPAPPDIEDKHESKVSAKSTKCEKKEASTLKEEKKKNKNKDKDNTSDSHNHKGTEQTKEQIVKEKDVESTKENHIRNHKDCNSYKEKEKEKEKEREKERERENKERERENKEREREIKEKEREKERERERELRESRTCLEELKRVKVELAAAVKAEAEARRALAAAAAHDRQRAKDHHQLKQAHAQLQHKISVWRTSERAALERRLGEERRARTAAENQLRNARQAANRTPNGECESGWCSTRRPVASNGTAVPASVPASEEPGAALRRELRRALDRAERLQLQLNTATQQLRSFESRAEDEGSKEEGRLAGACAALQERAAHLERSLSAETRVKLDLLSALGDAKRQIHIQEGLISKQEKEIEELKAQMLAVMPTEFVSAVGGVSKLRLESSPLDPNASVYTPKQLCSDA